MKNMHVLGMDINDYSVKEALRMVDLFLKDPKTNTVSFLSMDNLMSAMEDDALKKWLGAMDLMVPVSEEILTAAGIGSRSRLKEVEDSRFYKELLKKLSDESRTVFLLSEKADTNETFADYLRETAPGITIVGSYAFEELQGDPEIIVNEMNSSIPDVIFSRLSSPKQEQFIYEHQQKLNARMWVGLKEQFLSNEAIRKNKAKQLKLWVERTLFKKKVNQYTSEQEKGENL